MGGADGPPRRSVPGRRAHRRHQPAEATLATDPDGRLANREQAYGVLRRGRVFLRRAVRSPSMSRAISSMPPRQAPAQPEKGAGAPFSVASNRDLPNQFEFVQAGPGSTNGVSRGLHGEGRSARRDPEPTPGGVFLQFEASPYARIRCVERFVEVAGGAYSYASRSALESPGAAIGWTEELYEG